MSARQIVDRLTEAVDESNLCVILRAGDNGLETVLVADEKGRWSIAGGHAKNDESHLEAAKREVKEETGLDVEPEPLLWAQHAARKKPVNLFYAVTEETDIRPGGGDVTEVRWAPLNDLGELNGTDKLAIRVAANRVHDLQNVVEEAVEHGESCGYAVANVSAPPEPVQGIYLRINGKAAEAYSQRIAEWAKSLSWPATIIGTNLYESTVDALDRASRGRKLTPVMDALLHVSDALWRYESLIAPRLKDGYIILEFGPEIDSQRLLNRGLPYDLWNDLDLRRPRPTRFTVGESYQLSEFQIIKDAIESLKNEG